MSRLQARASRGCSGHRDVLEPHVDLAVERRNAPGGAGSRVLRPRSLEAGAGRKLKRQGASTLAPRQIRPTSPRASMVRQRW